MCGRFIQISDPGKKKVSILDLEIDDTVRERFEPHYNIAPTQDILTILNMPTPKLTFTHWGLVPFWAKDKTIGYRMINAQAETIATKPSFRESLRKRRCIILSDGFFEWKQENKTKTPYFIRMKMVSPHDELEAFEISRLVNSPQNDSPEIIKPAGGRDKN